MFNKKLKSGEKTEEGLEKIAAKSKESTTESPYDTNIAEQSEASAAPESSCDANIAEQSAASASVSSCDTNIGSETIFNFFFIYYITKKIIFQATILVIIPKNVHQLLKVKNTNF